jgi:ABC-2 type transport system permease protein
LVNIAVIAEESPTLLRSAPMQSTQLLLYKVLAALLPIWLLAVPCFVWLMWRGEAWFVPLMVFWAATICDAVLTIWSIFPTPANRVFERREETKRRSWIIAMLFGMQVYLWPALGYLATQGEWLGSLACLVAISLILGLAYWRSRQLGTTLGF